MTSLFDRPLFGGGAEPSGAVSTPGVRVSGGGARPMVLAAGVRIRRDDGSVLLVQHHAGVAAGRWSVPFDGVAEDEVAESAALRVLRDALHLEPGQFEFAETISIPSADEDIVVNVFDALGWAGEPRFNARDFDDAGWLDATRLDGVDVVPEVAKFLNGGVVAGEVHAVVEAALVEARQALLDAYEAIPERWRERELDTVWAPVDVLHRCAAVEAYTLGEAVRLAETPSHVWREFNADQAEADRKLRARPSDAEVRERLLAAHDDTLRMVQALMPEQLLHFGAHPSKGTVQVRQMLEGIAAHDREHTDQLRAMQATAQLRGA
ncbi:MAG: NUDIX domain-containing protein [Chloroflexota bacterium]